MAKSQHESPQPHYQTSDIAHATDIVNWLRQIQERHSLHDISTLSKACFLAEKLSQGLTTFYGKPCIQFALEVAEIIFALQLDQDTAAASIISSAVTLTPATEELIKNELGPSIAKLVVGEKQMNFISSLHKSKPSRDKIQIDKIRKMLLAMATDIRVVIIKLAERLTFMRGIKSIPLIERKQFAEEIFDIYAPLANRLGIGQLKWELEDLAFRYLDSVTYKAIANFLAERRANRELRIQQLITFLQNHLDEAQIKAKVAGRAKHIYSMYLKAQRKKVNYQEIYDQSAVRILVANVEDCYAALSTVHSLWQPITEEFDDYIANPKANGYRSIHTAVIADNGKHFEIQIRTDDMHEEAERGVAAHWIYKEKESNPIDDAAKIIYLRQLLDWHKEIAPNTVSDAEHAPLLDNQVYVITKAGDIIDLPQGATPLDFAYHIHSELGHRCRGAKVNGQIVPLTYHLRTGDKIEILPILHGNPSRDWLNPELAYIKTARARNKISHWFKQQAFNQDVEEGRQILERELTRLGLSKTISLLQIAKQLDLKDEDSLLASLSRGNIRLTHVLQALQPNKLVDKNIPAITTTLVPITEKIHSSAIAGSSDLLTRFAKCCKPIPGDLIIGYITQGRGISIHKKTCNNVSHLSDPRKFIIVNWDKQHAEMFSTDLKIIAQEHTKTLNDLTALFANEKISLINFHSNYNKNHNRIIILATIQIQNIEQLQRIMHRIGQLPDVIEVTRIKE